MSFKGGRGDAYEDADTTYSGAGSIALRQWSGWRSGGCGRHARARG